MEPLGVPVPLDEAFASEERGLILIQMNCWGIPSNNLTWKQFINVHSGIMKRFIPGCKLRVRRPMELVRSPVDHSASGRYKPQVE